MYLDFNVTEDQNNTNQKKNRFIVSIAKFIA